MNEPTELPGPNDPALTTEKGSRRMLIGLILVSVTIAAVAQIALKSVVDHVTAAQGGELHIGVGGLKALLSSPRVWAGLVLFGLAAVSWLFALSRASLSFAYPFAALGYVLIVGFSVLVLHETVPPLR